MDQNRNHIQYKIRREVAGYDSKGNPIYREVKVAVRPKVTTRSTQSAQAGSVQRTAQSTARRAAPKGQTEHRRVSGSTSQAAVTAHTAHTHTALEHRAPQERRRSPAPKKAKKRGIKRFIAPVICLAVIALVIFGGFKLWQGCIGYSDSIEAALEVSSESVIDTFKVDSTYQIAVYKNSGKLCASLMRVKGAGESKSYKKIKSCKSLDLSTFAEDLKGEDLNYVKSNGICFALDYSTSEQYGDYADYISDNADKDFKPGAISVEEDESTIFVLWYWTE